MTYTKETIDKYVETAADLFHGYMDMLKEGKTLNIMISTNNSKIGKVMNVSLLPVLTCGNCDHCKGFCYDIKACVRFVKNVLSGRARNTAIMRYNMDLYFELINQAMKRRRKNKFFRFHVGGEIPNYEYFCKMVETAKNNPDFFVWTYTKMHAIVNMYVSKNGGSKEKAIPANMCVMFSEWDGMPTVNPYGFPVFAVRLKNGNKDRSADWFSKTFRCPGNCDLCKPGNKVDGLPHGCFAKEDTFADEH